MHVKCMIVRQQQEGWCRIRRGCDVPMPTGPFQILDLHAWAVGGSISNL